MKLIFRWLRKEKDLLKSKDQKGEIVLFFSHFVISHLPKLNDECMKYKSQHFLEELRLSNQPFPLITKK